MFAWSNTKYIVKRGRARFAVDDVDDELTVVAQVRISHQLLEQLLVFVKRTRVDRDQRAQTSEKNDAVALVARPTHLHQVVDSLLADVLKQGHTLQ